MIEKGKTTFKVEWLKTQFLKLRKIYSEEEYSNEYLKNLLLEKYNNRKTVTGRFYNKDKNLNNPMTIEHFINYFLNNDYILTGYNVLVEPQTKNQPLTLDALNNILSTRKHYKKIQEASEKGSDAYVYNKSMQLNFKILANSWYGIQSMSTSTFYSPLIQNSITLTGQDLISTAIYFVETFIGNNERFKCNDDVISFIINVSNERYNILKYLDNVKTLDEVKEYIISQCDFDVDMKILNKLLDKRTPEELNRIYYKNQLIELFKNKYFYDKVKNMCMNNIQDIEFRDLVVTICLYNKIAWDKFIRISKQTRQVSVLTDTDSTFVYLGKIVEKSKALFGDDIPNLNYCNFYIYLLTEGVRQILWTFTNNCNILDSHKPIINLKNEFIYSRLLTTRNKKNYAGWLYSELGKIIEDPSVSKHLDIKGLSIRKTTVARTLRDEFQDILVNDILLPEKINPDKVMRDYNIIANKVRKSLEEGKTEYTLPKAIKTYTAYKNPASTEQVKSTIIWNALEKSNQITPPDNIRIVKIAATTLNHPLMLKLKEQYPDKYEIIKNTVFEHKDGELDISKNGLTAISLPLDLETIPDYIRLIMDVDQMVNANVKNANILLESLGIYCTKVNSNTVKNNNYKSNILEWV